jgi:hypothetical protein
MLGRRREAKKSAEEIVRGRRKEMGDFASGQLRRL